jgi:dimethylamine monooxygenase subunit A
LLNSYFTGRSQRIYLPFVDRERTLKLGLKSLKLEDWIEIDDQFGSYLQRKMELLEANYAEVFASLVGSETAQQEVLDSLINHLLHYFPDLYERVGDRILVNGQIWRISEFEHPLDLAGRLVQEDLCVMQKLDDRYVLTAASLCFPSRWRLVEKIGRPLVEIHQPVPGYSEKLGHPVDQYFDRLKPEYPAFRLNWSIVDTPELFLGYQSESKNAGEQLWIRVERQTLRRFEHCILFGIRTYRYPIEILKSYPDMAKGLAEHVRSLSPEMQLYKSIEPIREKLLTWLQASGAS